MKNKNDIIIYGTFLIVLVLLNLIVLRLDNSSYSFSEKKLGKNIVYPYFKDKKDEIIQNYISDYQNENYKINYSLGTADNYTSVLFKFFNSEDITKINSHLNRWHDFVFIIYFKNLFNYIYGIYYFIYI